MLVISTYIERSLLQHTVTTTDSVVNWLSTSNLISEFCKGVSTQRKNSIEINYDFILKKKSNCLTNIFNLSINTTRVNMILVKTLIFAFKLDFLTIFSVCGFIF